MLRENHETLSSSPAAVGIYVPQAKHCFNDFICAEGEDLRLTIDPLNAVSYLVGVNDFPILLLEKTLRCSSYPQPSYGISQKYSQDDDNECETSEYRQHL